MALQSDLACDQGKQTPSMKGQDILGLLIPLPKMSAQEALRPIPAHALANASRHSIRPQLVVVHSPNWGRGAPAQPLLQGPSPMPQVSRPTTGPGASRRTHSLALAAA